MRPCSGLMRSVLVCLVAIGPAVRLQAADEKANEAKAAKIAKTRAELTNADPKVRRTAAGSLIHSDISDQMLPEMRSALKDTDGEVRSTTATAIGNLGAAAVPAIPQLVAQLKGDSVKEARETAARALGRIGKAAPTERSAIAPLTTATKEDADPVTRVVALGALAMMEIDLPSQVTSLRKYLHHDEPLVRMKASHALGMIGAPAKGAAAEIAEVLKTEPDEHRRGYVARALGNVGDPAFLPALYAALEKETDQGSQGEMRGAIAKLGGKVPEKK